MPHEAELKAGSGAEAFAFLLRVLGIAVDSAQLRHRFGDAFAVPEMLRAAKELGIRARFAKSHWSRLATTHFPALVEWNAGGYGILAAVREDAALVHFPMDAAPRSIQRAEFEANWTGYVLLVTRRSDLVELHRNFDFSWFLGAIHKYRRILTEVLVASFFLQLFGLVTPIFFQVVTDKVLIHNSYSTLDVLAIGLLAVSIFEAILGGLRTYVFAHTTNRIDVELGARLFRHLLALPIGYFEARRTGDSVARVRELENIRTFLTGSAATLVIDLIFTFVFVAVMLLYSWQLTLIVLASLPVYAAISVLITPSIRRRLNDKFNRGAENQAFLVETINGVETLKAMAVEPQIRRRWEEQLAAYVTAGFRVTTLANWGTQAIQLVSKVVLVSTIYFGAYLVIAERMTIGELIAFNILSGRVAQPVLRLAQMWQDFQQTRVSVARLGDILNAQPEPALNVAQTSSRELNGDVVFDHATFRYRVDGPEVLHDVSLRLPVGKITGIVGPSGSGKSTLAKLVQRLHLPERGRVLIDGTDLAMADVSWLRRQIGVVLQENVLFNMSIRDNIALADPGIASEQVIGAAKLAGAHDFITQLPGHYNAQVGERGASLSGGQRQRIAIARALATNPRILILDEATSALDYESERAIQENMKRIASGRTVIIIAHRLSMVRFADQIATIDRGRLIEIGTHDELVQADGRYAALLRLQGGLGEIG